LDRFSVCPLLLFSLFVITVILGSGGKAGAPTILTDQSFKIALAAILLKDKGKIQVAVEFDTDSMTGFRIQQPVCYHLFVEPSFVNFDY
jgi:hypothetical protein